MPTPMVFPNFKGIPLTEAELSPHRALRVLLLWSKRHGVLSRDCLRFELTPYGGLRAFATHFIPAKQHLLHVPARFNLSFASLKTELHPDPAWAGWEELQDAIDHYEDTFPWNPHQHEQKDYFTINARFVMCIYGLLKKLETVLKEHQHMAKTDPEQANAQSNSPASKLPFNLLTFHFYWQALPKDIGNILYNWTASELWCLQGTSFANCFSEAQRFGIELYHQVIVPFATRYPDLFPLEGLNLELYFFINTVVLMQSFGQCIDKEDRPALLPIIDLFPGKSDPMFNCTLESCAIAVTEDPNNFQRFHVLTSACDIYAGDEIFIEYASLPASDYLMVYNNIPLDVEFIINNRKTYILLDFDEFLEMTLLQRHPNDPILRHVKRAHVYESFQLPKVIPITCSDLFRVSPHSSASCMPTLRQVFIFLQFNEDEAKKSIENARIQSQLSPIQIYHLFVMFASFIECSVNKPNRKLLQMVTATDGKVSEDVLATMRPDLSTAGEYSAAFQSLLNNPVYHAAAANNNSTALGNDMELTPNMRSAIFLQMSERLIVAVLINQFIHLFPEQFHELGYSVMREHLVSYDINDVLEVLCKSIIAARISQCIVCGSKKNVSKCSRCKNAYYCSGACQKEHWVYHRNVCKPMTSSTNTALPPQQQVPPKQLQRPSPPQQTQPAQAPQAPQSQQAAAPATAAASTAQGNPTPKKQGGKSKSRSKAKK